MWRTKKYNTILWGYPPHTTELILPNVIRLLDKLIGQPLVWHLANRPNALVPTSTDQWVALAEEHRDKQDGALDLFLESPIGISSSLTLDYPQYVRDFDVLTISLDAEHLIDEEEFLGSGNVYALFAECISLFQPFWASVADEELITAETFGKVHLTVDVTKVPGTIHWFNYFSDKIVQRLGGREKLQSAPVFQVQECDNPPGMILILQQEPFDYFNPEHRRRHEKIAQYLDLDRLHKLYPKRRDIHLEDRSLSNS
jgi:hypothetical protein